MEVKLQTLAGYILDRDTIMITVTGSLAFDHIMDFPGIFGDHIMPDKIHQINLSFLVNSLKIEKGGTAGNIAYNLARLKMPVSILGIAGSDFANYEEFLKKEGVNTSNIKIIDDFTSSAFIMTDIQDNQITAFYPGAMNQADSLSLEEKSEFVVISPNNPLAMVKFTKQAKSFGLPYMLDPGMQLPALNNGDLMNMVIGADILIGNDYEIELLKKKLEIDENQLLGLVKILITTFGPNGSKIQTRQKTYQIVAGKTNKVTDPTGAGDAYRAGFLAGYIKNFDLKVCGQMGSITSCYTVEKYGTTSHTFTIDEFKKRYQENFGEELSL